MPTSKSALGNSRETMPDDGFEWFLAPIAASCTSLNENNQSPNRIPSGVTVGATGMPWLIRDGAMGATATAASARSSTDAAGLRSGASQLKPSPVP